MSTPSSKKTESIPTQKFLSAVCSVTRWKIIAVILAEGPMGTKELAGKLRMNAPLVSKHIMVLRKSGILLAGRGRLNYLAENLRPAPGSNEIDFGQFLIRLPAIPK
jgi:hypothetical protein